MITSQGENFHCNEALEQVASVDASFQEMSKASLDGVLGKTI